MNIQITADSTCDLGESVAKRNIGIAPLCVILGDTTYHDGVDITPQDIFAYVEKTGELPKTRHPALRTMKISSGAMSMRGRRSSTTISPSKLRPRTAMPSKPPKPSRGKFSSSTRWGFRRVRGSSS